ncbi:P-type Ca2+ transporter type 2C [Methylomarinovum caldicuralii]|uniref:P-type Ca2+ transporter type 2C n=1 Tax=Methylomarinovum caldicuralii TaxID=438856 RepID=A0AAU9BQD5_9GAMM|nr:HAD-IC family P-type ATPase [Methylomarinovum caldicuralii]BCX80636.1 P-type Ca2+ transporter type 2C [Methylomarinovum caldicuralii]
MTAAIEVLHDRVPGRLRLRHNRLYRRPELGAHLEKGLHRLARRIRVNPRTATLTVEFDPAHRQEVLEQLSKLLQSPVVNSFHPVAAHPGRAPQPTARWHAMTPAQVLEMLDTSPQGLSPEVVRQRLRHYGSNVLKSGTGRSTAEILWEQVATPPVLLLGVSAVISVLTGGLLDAGVIIAVVGINTAIGYFTESTSERIIHALDSLTPLYADVIRAGRPMRIPIEELVPGDVICLTPGSYIGADARLLEAANLTVDESTLTGESLPVSKQAKAVLEPLIPLADRCNLVFRGTVVTGGSGKAVVVATGSATEIGIIQSLLQAATPPQTSMQRQLDRLGMELALLSSGICVLVFVVGVVRGLPFLEMLRAAISLAVAAVPEGLPTVATTTLALGVRRMRGQKVLIRQLNAVENLGAVQVVCFDKTGTLTLNRMYVTRIATAAGILKAESGRLFLEGKAVAPDEDPALAQLLEAGVLCSEVTENGGELDGSPTEKALYQCARDAGIDTGKLHRRHPRVRILHRADNRPYMATWHRNDDGTFRIAVKGNPETVLALCRWQLQDGSRQPLTEEARRAILATNEAMAGQALRVLGVAAGQTDDPQGELGHLTWLGMVGMEDAIRPGTAELIARFHRAGIDTVMITGDQSATAASVAQRLNLSGDKPLEILDSTRLDQVEPEVLRNLVQDVTVFARVSPAHKLKIIQALQANGKVVAMIGDGINDAPALKAADVGVAMGKRGSDVARLAADVVLEDDNLATLHIAIEQGRTLYNNTRKSLRFLLSTNLSEIEVMLLGVILGAGEVLTPMQLLWINLFTDIFPGLALALEPPEADVMEKPPRDPQEPILSRRHLWNIAREGAVITGGAFATYAYAKSRHASPQAASGLTFQTLTVAQLLHSFSCRSEKTAWHFFGNPYLNAAMGGSLALQLGTLVPPLRRLLSLPPPTLADMGAVAAGATLPLLVNETSKRVIQT